ncbi:MAG: hypothetical protein ACK4SA_11015 [Caldilinea sp.]
MLYRHKTLATAIACITLPVLLAALLALWPAMPAYAEGDPVTPNVAVITTTVKLASTTAFINVPVTLTVGTASVSSLGFRLDYDQSCLSIADIDADVSLLLANGFAGSKANNPTEGKLDVSVWWGPNDPPVGTLDDGDIVNIKFMLEPGCRNAITDVVDAAFAFSNVTFADQSSAPVEGAAYGGVYHLDVNQFPTDVTLTRDDDGAKENIDTFRRVGGLDATDVDSEDEHSFSLVSTCTGGAWDNQGFVISGSDLKTNLIFDYETKSSYSVCIEANDGRGGVLAKVVSFGVVDVNEAPTMISLDNNLVVAGTKASGDVVGAFTTVDPDNGQTHTYSLVSGVGDTDNGSFTIDGSNLKLAFDPVYNPAKPLYKIRVQTKDNGDGELTLAQQFNIIVVGKPTLSLPTHPDVPYVIADSVPVTLPINFSASGNTILSATMSITYSSDCLTYTTSSGWQSGTSGSATDNSGAIEIEITSAGNALRDGAIGYLSFTGKSSCVGVNSWTLLNFIGTPDLRTTGNLQVTPTTPTNGKLVVVNNAARGDCNSDGAVNAGDFTATAREIWDESSELEDVTPRLPDKSWLWTPLGVYSGSAMGCDSNVDRYIDIADLVCTVRRYFGATSCSSVAAAVSQLPVISAPSAVLANANTVIDLPIHLETNGRDVAAIAFTVNFDPEKLLLDDTDADQDGIPDMISLNAPASMMQMVMVESEQGRIDVMASGVMPPLPLLSDGVIANIRLTGSSQASNAFAPVTITNVSLGDAEGSSMQAEVVMLTPEGTTPGIFLPLVTQ